jgi:hypothetical protein
MSQSGDMYVDGCRKGGICDNGDVYIDGCPWGEVQTRLSNLEDKMYIFPFVYEICLYGIFKMISHGML